MTRKRFITYGFLLAIVGFFGGFSITNNLMTHSTGAATVATRIQAPSQYAAAIDNATLQNPPILPQTPSTPAPLPSPIASTPVVSDIQNTWKSNNCPKPSKDYDDESDLNVGQEVSLLDPTYVPDDLVELGRDMAKPIVCIKKDVADALKKMFAAAKADGYTILVSSGFRDYDTQKSILDRETSNENPNASVAVAKPGYSEHQLGLAVDLTSKSIAYGSADTAFGNTRDSKWLMQHADLYGFALSYPKGKESITGYMYEPWHYRYVGITAAKEIMDKGITVNQYYADKQASKNTLN